MAFTRATGKHRAPGRLTRTGAKAVGVATLAATGSLASPALAAGAGTAPAADETGLAQIMSIEHTLADRIDAQAAAQQHQADVAQKKAAAEAKAKKKAEARKKAAEKAARAKAKAKAKAEAAARAEKARETASRAARSSARATPGTSYQLPVAGSYVTTGYKSSGSLWSSGSHSGIDFHAASGSSVVAVGAGTVVEAGWGGAYGNNIVLRMTDGTYTQYGHLSSIGVTVGQSVGAGQRIGLSGSTGNSTGPHLHFEARTTPSYGSDMDPVAYLRAHGVTV
ncbi:MULTISPECIES: M23 family metallopeptidase [unclassified Streptomyces]|uniref:M23 family metallopeptidase n=1 Tax=unclassified Streptomyces TaxID=2593676 RepID=UPI0003700093|nr:MULTISPECIES: M23 family metallopeptidase [unclassified Streptomyces]MYY01123.1 peptidoglycan DD-metalloendopeptidase family protein [Streptomyces sp. SID4913]